MKCKGKHHSSICDKTTTTLLTIRSCSVTYPVVLIETEGVKCHALIDTGVGTSYASNTLIDHINKKPIQTETKKIKTLMSTNTRKIKIYSVKIQDVDCKFSFEIELNRLEKKVLLELPNPNTENYKIHMFI